MTSWCVKQLHFFQEKSCEIDGVTVSREIGLCLAQDFGQMRLPMNEDSLPTGAIYRDDNQHLWLEERQLFDEVLTADQATKHFQCGPQLAETVVGQRLAFTEYPWLSKGDEIGYRIEEVTEEARLAFLQAGNRDHQRELTDSGSNAGWLRRSLPARSSS